MIRRGLLAVCVVGLIGVALAGSSGAWTTNLVVLDDGTCRTNLQIGSDITASSSATPSFVAYGDGPVSSYQVFIDGASIGTFAANSRSYVCIYAPTLSQGRHVLTGNEVAPQSTLTLTPFNFSVDSIPPSTPSAPVMNTFFDTGASTTDGITKYRNLGFSGTAEPNSSVQLFNGLSGLGGSKADSTGAWSLATQSLADGNYQMTAAATDSAGNRSPSSPVTSITVDGTPPTVTLTNPLAGQIVTGTVPLQASASDNLGLWKVDFQVDGVTKQTVTGAGPSYSWNWNTTGVANGSHTLTAVATDLAGNATTSTTATVTVSNGSASAPTAPTLSAPTAGNGSVGLSWSPTSDGGSPITGYKLYRGTASGGETLLATLGTVTSYTDNNLPNGTTYFYKVSAVNAVGEGALSTEQSATPATVPGAPSLVSATAGSASVSLSWSAPTSTGGAAVTGYKLYRGTASGGETLLTTLGNVTSYTDGGLTNGTTYYYKVSAVNQVGEGALSNERSATPQATSTVPGAPTLAAAGGGNGTVNLSWTAPSSNGGSAITAYRIYRGTAVGGETFLTSVGAVTSYIDSAVSNGTTYYYKVSAVNAIGEGGLSNELSATPAGPPGAPAFTAATAGNGAVSLSWTAPTSNGGLPVTSYKVYRGTSSGGETLLTALGNVTTYTDSGLANGTTYFYKVSALNTAGEGAASSERSATPATVPTAPTLNSANGTSSSVALSWSAPSSSGGSSVSGYGIYRSTSSGTETLLTTLGNVTSWTDTSLTNGTTYYYKVSALNSVGESLLSGERSATPMTIPGAPTLNSASGADSTVSLGWSAPASNGGSPVTGYRVYRSTSSGTETLLTTLGNVTGWTDTGLTNGTTYYYKVSALNSVGEGALSGERSATPTATVTVPGAPTLNSATSGNGTATLSWSAPVSNGGSAVTGYKVYRGTTSGGETLLTTLGTAASWTDTGLANGTTYFYKVSAVNSVGEGSLSGERSAMPATVAGAPQLAVTGANASATLTWTAPSSNGGSAITGYKVYRGTSSGGEALVTTLGNVTSYFDSGLANGTTYYYEVTAVNGVGEGALSNERSATPATIPGAPTLNSASAGNGSVALNWSAPGSNGSAVTSYKIYRGTTSGGETLLTTVGAVTSYTDTSVTNGVTYYYMVSAVNSVGEGGLSGERSATPVSVPGAPTLNSATPGNGTVSLGWSAPASTGGSAITAYKIYRGTTSGGEALLTTAGAVTSYTDTTVTNGVTYYYKVSAVNTIGEGALSGERSTSPATTPGAPTLMSVNTGNATTTLAWNAPAANGGSSVTNYKIYRSTSSGTETLLTTLGNVNSWTDTGLANGTTYFYKVSAVNATGEGSMSNEGSGMPAGAPSTPSLTAATAGNGSVALSWSAAAPNGSAVSGYRIYRSTTSGNETLLTTVGTVTSYTDTGLANGTTYFYEISAVNGIGESLPSNERSSTPTTLPGAPSLNGATGGNASVALSWSAPAANGGSSITNYKIYRSTSSGTETLLTTLGNVNSWTDTGLANGTTYFYKVSAVNAAGEGAQSNELSARPVASDSTPPSQPGTPKSLIAGTSQIALDWSNSSDNVGVTGYRVYRNGVLVATVATSYFLDSGLNAASSYTYAVAAVDAAGNASSNSTTQSVKTAAVGTGTTGTIGGAVFGSTAAPIKNASVQTTLANGTVKSMKTSVNGAWSLSNLPAGSYTVTVSASGYRSQSMNLSVTAGGTVLGLTALSP